MNDVYYFKLENTWYERKKTMGNVTGDKFLIVPSSYIPNVHISLSHTTSRLSNYVISTLVTSESFDMEMRYQTHKVLLSSSLFSGLALYVLSIYLC